MMLHNIIWAVVIVLVSAATVSADTPANCTYEDIQGTWVFELGPGDKDRTVNCSEPFEPTRIMTVKLAFPDVATDQFDNIGHWTLIYNQGFEVIVAGRKYFGFSYYKGKESFCDRVVGGWSHDLLSRDWACYNGKKTQPVRKLSQPELEKPLCFHPELSSEEMVTNINKGQNLWTAKHYSQFDGLTVEDSIKMAGGRKSQIFSWPKPAPLTVEHKRIRESLPKSFDWRDIDGVSFVSPVRNQARCGSCYAFASMAMAEARVRIQTNNTQNPVFSTQDIVECSQYSQGCDGGFPYLVAGKYAEDFGLVDEKCNPYTGKDGKCQTDPSCERHYFTDYSYVGGYYGGCNEVLMQQAIYERGPVAISFAVYPDFRLYKSGVYHHTDELKCGDGLDRFNPFVFTNHVMLVVGWGQLPAEQGSTKYWIVKNSWGSNWGMEGYVLVLRGSDECGIESIAAETTPIYKYKRPSQN